MSNFLMKLIAFLTLLSLSIECTLANTSQPPLSAEKSEPYLLGWMQGFPPPDDKRIMQPDSNFFSFPKLRWSVCHMRELLPTASIERDINDYTQLEFSLVPHIDSLVFQPLNSTTTMTWEESLKANYTDGILVIHNGKVVYERYMGCLDKYTKHAAMSMTKSITGLVAEMLIEKGLLNPLDKVASIIPELAESAFGDATVRQVMDMTTSLDYSENYSDPNAGIWQYSAAANPMPKPDNYQGPVGYFEYLQTVEPSGEHGETFGYKTVNTDVLGWLISRVTNKRFDAVVSDLLWKPIGMQQSAYINVDGIGTPFAGGGLSATLRDLGRLGLTILNQGKIGNKQVIEPNVVKRIREGGDKEAFAKAGYDALSGGSYKSMWWLFHNEHQAFAARGVHGQTIYIDPIANMVIVRFASHPNAKNSYIDPTSLPAYEALAKYLMQIPLT